MHRKLQPRNESKYINTKNAVWPWPLRQRRGSFVRHVISICLTLVPYYFNPSMHSKLTTTMFKCWILLKPVLGVVDGSLHYGVCKIWLFWAFFRDSFPLYLNIDVTETFFSHQRTLYNGPNNNPTIRQFLGHLLFFVLYLFGYGYLTVYVQLRKFS